MFRFERRVGRVQKFWHPAVPPNCLAFLASITFTSKHALEPSRGSMKATKSSPSLDSSQPSSPPILLLPPSPPSFFFLFKKECLISSIIYHIGQNNMYICLSELFNYLFNYTIGPQAESSGIHLKRFLLFSD